jgi:Clp amino terminal domain, pathogenicity island component
MNETFYKFLLRAYPKDFRLEFESEMLQVFRLQHKAAKLERRMLSFWFCTVKDIVFGAIREHIQKQRKPNMVTINRFDEGARLAFHFARAEAVLLEHSLIEPEHIFLGLVRQNDHLREVLERLDGNLESFRVRLQTINAKDPFARVPQITKRTRFAMEQSAKEAKALGSNHVDSRHIMLGLMADQNGMVYDWLSELADPNEIRNQILSA